jgi:hypothetical protein
MSPEELLYAFVRVLSLSVSLRVVGTRKALVYTKRLIGIPHEGTRELRATV